MGARVNVQSEIIQMKLRWLTRNETHPGLSFESRDYAHETVRSVNGQLNKVQIEASLNPITSTLILIIQKELGISLITHLILLKYWKEITKRANVLMRLVAHLFRSRCARFLIKRRFNVTKKNMKCHLETSWQFVVGFTIRGVAKTEGKTDSTWCCLIFIIWFENSN